MSPFAQFFRQLRRSRALKQKQVAELLGYEQSYISALERGMKGLPRRLFIDRLIRKMDLGKEEIEALEHAVLQSERRLTLPSGAHEDEYRICYLLKIRVGQLTADQRKQILSVLERSSIGLRGGKTM